ncbi:MAG: 30S ribosomal protein S8 [Candidatus Shapirobacteria bacterium]|jgi:small subunit ribosomal protein S8
MINSPATDFLIRLKNAYLAGNSKTTSPFSGFRVSLAELLKKYHYIADFSIEGEIKKTISIKLNSIGNGLRISSVRVISRPGRRIYGGVSEIPWGKTPDSLIIVSTSSGVLSQKEAVAQKIGGELVAEVF